jgi:hypothetical protein
MYVIAATPRSLSTRRDANAFPNTYRKALAYIGCHSGLNEHKLSIVGQNPEFTAEGNPTFKETTFCIECKTIYTYKMELNEMPDVQETKKWHERKI